MRYLAWLWDPQDEAGAREAKELSRRIDPQSAWSHALANPGLEVRVTGVRPRSAEVYSLGDGSGVILGKLFGRTEGISCDAPLGIPDEETRRILAHDGRDLISRYWGRYVAFLCDAGGSTTRVLRSPCGSLPCLSIRVGRLQLYCSWIEDLALAGVDRWSINWPVVYALLCGAVPDMHPTALEGLHQVLGGECVTHAGHRTQRAFYWDPIRTIEEPDDKDAAARKLRACVVDCVRAWRGCHEEVIETLSGGLDSSIVAASQDRSSLQHATFVNFYLAESDSDERKFARLVAHHLGVELTEWLHDSSLSLKGLLRMHRMPFPTMCLHLLELSHREVALCAQTGATAVVAGHGGDQVFYSSEAWPCAASYWAQHGLTASACSAILGAAYRDKRSVWRTWRDVRGQRQRPLELLIARRLGTQQTLLETEIVESVQRSQLVWSHPLLRDYAGVDPVRLTHAEQALVPDDYYDPFCGPNYPDRISPLLSQPVVELCLRLPRHLLTSGGWTRAVARRAFQNDLPYEIVSRREKGGVRDHYRSILQCNRDFVREMLLDGELRHILNRERAEAVLAADPTRDQATAEELLRLLCALGWLRQF